MISKTCNLIVRDLYLYDFKSAYPRILQNIDWDFGDIDLNNKKERNISIGLAQRDNENLSSFLMTSVDSLLTYYLKENGVTDSEIIATQRDGFILSTNLSNTSDFMKLDFREYINFIIITPDRNKFLTSSDIGISVKGISNRYDALDSIYSMFSKLNFYNKNNLFSQLHNIKRNVLENKNKNLYMVDINGKKVIQTKRHGILEVSDESFFDIKDIDTKKYFDHYFKEFIQSVFLEFYK